MFAILKSIFGIFSAPKTVEKTVDAVINTADKLVFTDEEKAEMSAQMREWFLKYLHESRPQTVARRHIAFLIFYSWLGLIVFSALVRFLGVAFETQRFVAYSDWLLRLIDDSLSTPVSIVLGFYFLAHTLRAVPNKGKG